jgi:hypothetical protein
MGDAQARNTYRPAVEPVKRKLHHCG